MSAIPRQRPCPPNPSGVHFLAAPGVAGEFVRSSGAGPGDLVVEFGAGTGALTAPLAATGARILAVERDPAFVARLRRRFATQPTVRVVPGDLRTVPLPRRSFAVVANVPFAVSTPLLRRLLAPLPSAMSGADLIVEWGFAKRLTAPFPPTLELAWWATCFDLRLRRRIPACCFAPTPRVDAAHLVIRPRETGGRRALATAWAVLGAVYAAPSLPAEFVLRGVVPRRRAHRLLTASGIDPPTPARDASVRRWARLAVRLAGDDSFRPPALPARLCRR